MARALVFCRLSSFSLFSHSNSPSSAASNDNNRLIILFAILSYYLTFVFVCKLAIISPLIRLDDARRCSTFCAFIFIISSTTAADGGDRPCVARVIAKKRAERTKSFGQRVSVAPITLDFLSLNS